MTNSKNTTKRIINTLAKKGVNITVAPKAAKQAPVIDTTAGTAKTVAADLASEAKTRYAALNTAFLSKYNKRPIFGEKRPTPVDYSKHNPVNPTDRDYAFCHAIKTVYGEKPFTANDVRVDTGNIARAVKLNLVQALGAIDGNETFKLVSNQA